MVFVFDIILAVDCKNGIGKEGKIPWNCPVDQVYFKQITTQKQFYSTKNIVIMGYKTWESIGKPLENRINIVIKQPKSDSLGDRLFKIAGVESATESVIFANSFEAAIEYCRDHYPTNRNIFIIGGKSLYDKAINMRGLRYVYLTKIAADYRCDVIVNTNMNNLGENKSFMLIDTAKTAFLEFGRLEMINVSFEKYQHCHTEIQYLNLMEQILLRGETKDARGNGSDTLSLFGGQMEFDLKKGFPLLTTKKMFLRGVFEELKFFLTGQTNTKLLEEKGVKIWTGNTSREFLDSVGLTHYKEGDLGTSYSFQFKHYGAEYKGMDADYSGQGIDQFEQLINDIIKNRFSRRLLMTTYNPTQLKQGPLPPCHGLTIQFGIENDTELCCHMTQRSADFVLGVPFNIASYALMLHIIVNIVNTRSTPASLRVGRLIMSFGDIHIYKQHIEAAKKQLERTLFSTPELQIKKSIASIEDLVWEDIVVVGYESHPNDLGAKMVA